MKKTVFKIIQQAALIGVACFLLWIAFSRSLKLVIGMDDVDMGFHGNLALIITVTFGFFVGVGLVGAFFYMARKQSADEDE